MVVAFMSVLLSSTTALNEIAWMLIVGILIDCFITTKIVIPASIGLTGAITFWPRRFAANAHAHGAGGAGNDARRGSGGGGGGGGGGGYRKGDKELGGSVEW